MKSLCDAAVFVTDRCSVADGIVQHTCNGRVGIQQAQLLQNLCCPQLIGSSKRGSAEAHTQLAMSCRCQHGIAAAVPVAALLLLPAGFRAVLPHGAHVCGSMFLVGGVCWREIGPFFVRRVSFGRKNAGGVILRWGRKESYMFLFKAYVQNSQARALPQCPTSLPLSCCGACFSAPHTHAGARDAAIGWHTTHIAAGPAGLRLLGVQAGPHHNPNSESLQRPGTSPLIYLRYNSAVSCAGGMGWPPPVHALHHPLATFSRSLSLSHVNSAPCEVCQPGGVAVAHNNGSLRTAGGVPYQ